MANFVCSAIGLPIQATLHNSTLSRRQLIALNTLRLHVSDPREGTKQVVYDVIEGQLRSNMRQHGSFKKEYLYIYLPKRHPSAWATSLEAKLNRQLRRVSEEEFFEARQATKLTLVFQVYKQFVSSRFGASKRVFLWFGS